MREKRQCRKLWTCGSCSSRGDVRDGAENCGGPQLQFILGLVLFLDKDVDVPVVVHVGMLKTVEVPLSGSADMLSTFL